MEQADWEASIFPGKVRDKVIYRPYRWVRQRLKRVERTGTVGGGVVVPGGGGGSVARGRGGEWRASTCPGASG